MIKDKLKRGISGALAMFLAVGCMSGCGDKRVGTDATGTVNDTQDMSSEQNTMGRFLESEITLPEEVTSIYNMKKLSDGRIEILAENAETGQGYQFYSEDAGETFTAQETDAPFQAGWLSASAIAPDGSAVVAGYFEDEANMEFAIKTITPEGHVEMLSVDLPEENEGTDFSSISEEMDISNMLTRMEFDAGGRLFAQDLVGNVLAVDLETGVCEEAIAYDGGTVSYFGIVGENMYLVTEDEIAIYHTSDGSAMPNDAVLDELIKTDNLLNVSAAEGAYALAFGEAMDVDGIVYVNHDGVYYHANGGSISEQLINGEMNSLGDELMSFMSIVMPTETEFLVLTVDGQGMKKIYKYTYDKNVSAVPETELTIYALEDSVMLQHAISLYQKANQDVYIKVEIGMSGEDGITAEDAIRALNTEIAAGNVPDVLILDGLPVESYIEKGILADISDVVDEVEKQDGIFKNIKETYERDGAFYGLPARFYTEVVNGDDEAIAATQTIADYVDYAEQIKAENPDKAIFQHRSAEELLWTLYQADSANWMDENGKLDATRLKDWLSLAKRLYDIDAYEDEGTEIHSYEGGLIDTAFNGTMGAYTKNNMLSFGTITSMMGIAELSGINAKTGERYTLFNNATNATFVPYLIAGVTAESKSPEVAKDFLRTLLGKEVASIDGNGFPINKAGWQAICEESLELYGADSITSTALANGEGEIVTFEMNTLTEDELNQLTEMFESLDTPVLADATIQSLVIDQGEQYLKGEISLEDALSAIQQKMNLYLAE